MLYIIKAKKAGKFEKLKGKKKKKNQSLCDLLMKNKMFILSEVNLC